MKIEITSKWAADGREFYEWDLWDGPDRIDHVHGYAADIIAAFSKLIEWRERIANDYTDLTNETDRTGTEGVQDQIRSMGEGPTG